MTRENRNRTIAIAVTVTVHVVAVVLLIVMALTTPLPLPGEAGVEVNLGMYNQGMGAEQQPKPKKVAEAPKPQPQQVKEETVTQNTEETPAIEEPKPKKEEPKVNQRALFKPVKNQQEPTSEGNTQTPGDQGQPDGNKDVNSYEGQGGSGGGPSYSLGGRGVKHLTSPDKKDVEEEGIVVVDIWVDREGRVKRAQVGKGTNIANTRMQQTAVNAALSSVFAPDPKAAELQRGTITYNFIIRQ
ncbi:MAG: TonB family protein [Bacteroidales bacterium]|nr:TonB family protein [Bacteroidales bacterium]